MADDRQQLLAALSGGPAGQGHRLPRPAGSVDCRLRTGQGERWVRWSWLADPAPFAATTAVCVTDVHEDRSREETLRQDSWHDALTGVLNRGRFVDLVEEALIPEVEGCVELGMLFADLDGFKAVNDLGGHALGDRVLHDAAERMTGRLRPQDVLGRVGGDEFAILCRGSRTDLLAVVSRMAAVFDQPFAVLGHVVHVGLTVGMAMASPGDNAASLLERADHAMYVDKRSAPHTAPLPG
ncbi:MAG TPA: GGDEF domain-containing protein [Motilibacteraceae bacterium]|nr:GGDEF domain-containing protein [Motilibacteraceae bacterium]